MFEKKYKVENQRKHKRLAVDYLLKYRSAGSETEDFVSNLKDISAGGLRFWSERFLPEETLLNVSTWIPPIDRVFHALARVVRIRESKGNLFYIAVSFVEVSYEDQNALNQFIEHLSSLRGARSLVHDPQKVTRKAFNP